MANDFAALADVEEMLGTLEGYENDFVSGLIRRASAMVRSQVASADIRIANGTLDRQTVADVVTDMVIRVLRNPEGIKQETIGPTATVYDPLVAAGRLFLDPDELFILTPPAAVRAAVGTIRAVPTLAPRPHPWQLGFRRRRFQ